MRERVGNPVDGNRVSCFTESMAEHKPDPKRVQSRCRVDCSCGWVGPVVSVFGEGHIPWVEHFKAAK